MENVDQFLNEKNDIGQNVPYSIVAKFSGQQTHAFFFYHLDYYNMDHIQSFKTR